MHYYIDIVAHTTAFDTPVVGHWLGELLTQQYTLNLSQLRDNQGWCPRPGIKPGLPAQETNVLPTELTPPPSVSVNLMETPKTNQLCLASILI